MLEDNEPLFVRLGAVLFFESFRICTDYHSSGSRKRLIEFLDNPKFNDLVKGCLVQYKGDNSKDDSYMIAQIIGVKQGTKKYTLTSKHKTIILLVIQ